ncbi:MAG: DEAD/DEAH box helicase [Candidatus Aenigmatarchaeota archaeon]
MRSESQTYDSVDKIVADNSLSEKEKIIFSQLLDLCSYRKEYSEENYRKFIELVTARDRQPPSFIFSKLCYRKVPIEVRKSKSWDEVKVSLHELDKKLQENLGWDLERFGPSFSKFVERYDIIPINFQVRSWEKILLNKKNFFVITAPTGFGKTECFLLPIMFSLFRQKIGNGETKQSTAAFVYPRRILIEDQASRLIKAIKILWELHKEEILKLQKHTSDLPEQPIIIGLQKGEIPQTFDEQQLESSGILKRESNGSSLTLVKCIHKEGTYNFKLTDERFHNLKGVFKCEKCGFKIFISLSRDNHKKVITEIKNIPFVLLTTFESLEKLFLENEFSQFFKNLQYVVVDETHVYQSIYGLHISHILKKLFEILKLQGNDLSRLKLIFSSATLPKPTEFVAKLLSFRKVEPTDIENIERDKEIDSEILPNKYKYFLYLLTKSYEYPLKTYGLIQTVMYFAHVINKIYNGTRTVAFFDTKGSLYRLRRQYIDAERKGLVRYRIRSVHDPNIPFSHNWNLLFDRLNKTLRVDEITIPIPAIHVTSDFKEQLGDIMFCTSAFELGIDERTINSIIQYGSPRNLLGFVQRVGRGNRITDDRFFLTILDSFDPIDAFYFQNNYLLSEEAFEREGVSIPETNKIVEKIHEILLGLNKEFLSQSKTFLEELTANTVILEVFKKIVIEKKLSLSNEFINLIDELCRCPEDGRNSLLSDKIIKLQEDYKSLEEEIEVRNLEEIDERANEILLELEKNIERRLPKQTVKEILEGKVFSDIKTKLVSLIESLKHVDEKSQFQVSQRIREIENNFRLIEEEYKTARILYELIFTIGDEFRANLYKLSGIIRKYIFNKLHEEEFNKKIIEQDSIFLKLIGLECLRNSLIYRRELERQATRWEKFIGLLQSCFWFNLSYLVGENKFFEEYENLIEKLPYVSKSYFEQSMEFPVNILRAGRPREGYMVSDVFIKYFPLKVDFEYIKEQRRSREAVLDLTFKKIKETEELIEVIAYFKRKRGYEYLIKRDESRTYNLPLQVPLKLVYENIFGYVPFCFNCFNISTNERECESCGREVRFVKIFGRPIFNFLIEEKTVVEKIGNLILSPIYVLVILEGSENELIPLSGNKKMVNVRLKYPLIFPLFTPAFVVDLNFIFEDIKKQYNSKDIEIIFHSFAHALLRVIASLTGFSEETFFYSYDLSKGKIYVFERYQGGIGAIDKFFKKIKDKKNEVVSRLFNLVDCEECKKEDRDGCPFCLWISWCKEGFRIQSNFISRKKLKNFIERYKELLF